MTKKFLVPISVKKVIRSLHPDIKKKLREGFKEIMLDPHVGKDLRDELKGLKSHRVGHYRIVYYLSEASITIVTIGPRKTIYTDTYRLIQKNKMN